MNASTKPLPSLSYGPKFTCGSAATTASRAIVRAFGPSAGCRCRRPRSAYRAMVCGMR